MIHVPICVTAITMKIHMASATSLKKSIMH